MSGRPYAETHEPLSVHLLHEQVDRFDELAAAAGLSRHDFFVMLFEEFNRLVREHDALATAKLRAEVARLEQEYQAKLAELKMEFACMVCEGPLRATAASMEFLSKHRGHRGCMELRSWYLGRGSGARLSLSEFTDACLSAFASDASNDQRRTFVAAVAARIYAARADPLDAARIVITCRTLSEVEAYLAAR